MIRSAYLQTTVCVCVLVRENRERERVREKSVANGFLVFSWKPEDTIATHQHITLSVCGWVCMCVSIEEHPSTSSSFNERWR